MAAPKPKPAPTPESSVVRVDAGELRAVLKRLADIVQPRATSPILGCVRLTTATGFLTIEATDQDRYAQEQIEAGGDGAWDVCVPATRLRIAVDSAEGEMQLDATGDVLRIRLADDAGSWRLATLPAADWPDRADDVAPVTARLTVAADVLAKGLARVAPAMSSEETRYYLNGVCFETVAAGGLLLTATDGHRLAHVEIAAAGPDGRAIPEVEAIVPRRTVAILQGLDDGEIHIELRPNLIYAAAGRLRIWSRLIEGSFPDWRKLVPAGQGDRVLTCEAAALRQAARALKPVDDTGKSKMVVWRWSAERTALRARSIGGDEGELTLVADLMDLGEFELGLNADYLATICDQVGSARVRIEATQPAAPVLFLPEGGHPADRFVLMPMRV